MDTVCNWLNWVDTDSSWLELMNTVGNLLDSLDTVFIDVFLVYIVYSWIIQRDTGTQWMLNLLQGLDHLIKISKLDQMTLTWLTKVEIILYS